MSDFDERQKLSPISQWIASLAISVVCCAGLFVGLVYCITDQVSMVSLRMDLLRERQDRMMNELELIHRQVAPNQAGVQVQAPQAAAPEASSPAAASAFQELTATAPTAAPKVEEKSSVGLVVPDVKLPPISAPK